jgi:hypothetical protein
LFLHQTCLNRVSLIYKSTGSGDHQIVQIAWSLVDSATTKLKEQTRTFHNVHSKALEVVTKCNDKIS